MNVNEGPDVIEQVPAGGGVMTPGSGSYGDGAAADRLRKSLSVPGGSGSPPERQPSPVPAGGPSGSPPAPAAPGTVPDVLLAPSSQPDVPVSQPLGPMRPSPTAAVDAAQRRLQLLSTLSESQEVSEETREWAKTVLNALAAGRR